MKKKYKKILIIGGVAIVIVVIVILWISKANQPPTKDGAEVLPSSPEKEVGEEGEGVEKEGFELIKLSDEEIEVFDFWENSLSSEVYYITLDGMVRSGKVGPDPEISIRGFLAINKIRPNSDGSKVLVSFGDPKSPEWKLFDSNDGVWRPIPSYFKDMVWGEENKVISVANTGSGKSLILLDIEEFQEGEEQDYEVLIRNFNFNDVDMEFSSPDSIVLIEKPASFYKSKVWKFDFKELKLTQLSTPKEGTKFDWRGNSDIVFKYEFGGWFGILNKELNIMFPVPFNTFPSKCGASESDIYCFVPYDIPTKQGINLPEDYYKNKFYTIDSLYKINRDSSEVRVLVKNTEFGINIDGTVVKEIGNKLYFINKYDKGLYRLTYN